MSYWELSTPDRKDRRARTAKKYDDDEFETNEKAIKKAVESQDADEEEAEASNDEDEYQVEATPVDDSQIVDWDAATTKKRKRATPKRSKAPAAKKRRVSSDATTTTTPATTFATPKKPATTTTPFFTSFQTSNTIIQGSADPSKWKFASWVQNNVTATRYKELMDNVWYEPGIIKKNSPKPSVEICFSFDMTGSMAACLDELKGKLTQTCTTLLGDLPNIRIALIAHGDYCDTYGTYYIMRKLDFTNDLSCLEKFVAGCGKTGGGDAEECYEMALHEAQQLNWSVDSNCAKVLVMIGDDVPHKSTDFGNDLKLDWKQEVNNLIKLLGGADSENFRIYSIQCLNRSYADNFYQSMADMSHGTRFTLDAFSSIVEVFMGLCYRESADAQLQVHHDLISNSQDQTIVRLEKTDENDLTDAEMLSIHCAIHDPSQTSVTIRGKSYDIAIGKAGCRFANVEGITYIEQSKEKKTKYAKLAQSGKKITWVVRSGQWGLILDDAIEKRGSGGAATTSDVTA